VSRPLAALAAALCLALPGTGAWAGAQTIYRCGPDGREYSQTPCKDGRVVDAADPRSPDQQREARQIAESQARLARQLEAERRQREAKAPPPPQAGGIGPAPPPGVEQVPAVVPRDADRAHRKDGKAAQAKAAKDFSARAPTPAAGARP
jgi:hypothetical protein